MTETNQGQLVIARCGTEEAKADSIGASRSMRLRKMVITKDRTVFQWEKVKAEMKIVREVRDEGKWAIVNDKDEAVVGEFKNKKT